tara:strand:+ start:617 stop:2422 length:1806 start_codon:yes stop_codon:yes gene_type:complete
MKKGKMILIPIINSIVAITFIIAQDGGYLSQKLMVENNIRERIKDALSKLIESHKYVVNVDVELEVLDEIKEEFTYYSPRESEKKSNNTGTPAEKTAEALVRIQEKMVQENQKAESERYSVGLPIPGFEVDVTTPKLKDVGPLTQSMPISPSTLKQPAASTGDDVSYQKKEVIDKVLSTKRPSKTVVKRMELSLILQEGAAPELIENIRQLTMAAAKFDRDRGDKLTIMTASFKERRDQRTAEQVMLKNIAEKIDKMEQKRITQTVSWRDDIERYKEESAIQQQKTLDELNAQLEENKKLRLEEAAEFQKREFARKDSIRNSKLETEIQALKDMLAMNESEEDQKEKELDSTRFAMLDNEMQGLRKMLLEAMLQKSEDSTKQAQAKIEAELAEREREKADRDSVIAEKIAALDAVQADLANLEAEAAKGLDTKTILIIALGVVSVGLIVMLLMQRGKGSQQQQQFAPPMPPYPYPPRPRRRKRKRKAEKQVEETPKEEPAIENTNNEEVTSAKIAAMEAEKTAPNGNGSEPVSPAHDPNVLKSEIDDIRKSIVSMSVGQPAKTSTIVKEWLEQPGPETGGDETAEPEAAAEEDGGEESGEE